MIPYRNNIYYNYAVLAIQTILNHQINKKLDATRLKQYFTEYCHHNISVYLQEKGKDISLEYFIQIYGQGKLAMEDNHIILSTAISKQFDEHNLVDSQYFLTPKESKYVKSKVSNNSFSMDISFEKEIIDLTMD